MKKYVKKTLVLLLAALLTANIVSCGAENTDPAADETAASTETVQETETEEKPKLPEKDYKGYSFRIVGNHGELLDYMLAFESIGEPLNDAIFDANTEVMEAFNIRFEDIEVDYRGIAKVGNMIMAGGDDMDLAYMHNCDTAQYALEGWFLNINDLPHVDTSAPWWPQNTVDSLTLNGKMYYFSNFSSYRASMETQVAFFNKDLLTDFGLENPYELVWNGDWTLDKAQEMTENLYVDENGDGTRDLGDSFGLVAFSFPYRWAESFGIEMYVKTPNSSELLLDANKESVLNIVDKLHNWLFNGNNSTWIAFEGAKADGRSIFEAGRSLFIFDTVGSFTPILIETDVDFGIVPYPKADDQQENYYAGCGDGLVSVPTTTADTERTGIIVEAMAYEGYDKIMPAYIQTTLKSRYATDEECSKMLELIFKNQVMSFAYLFANAVPNGMQFRIINDTVPENIFASWYAQNEQKELALMETLTEFYK